MKHLECHQYTGSLGHASSSLPVLIIQRPQHLSEITMFVKVNWLKLTVSKTEAIISGNGNYPQRFPQWGALPCQITNCSYCFMDLQTNVGFVGVWWRSDRATYLIP